MKSKKEKTERMTYGFLFSEIIHVQYSKTTTTARYFSPKYLQILLQLRLLNLEITETKQPIQTLF